MCTKASSPYKNLVSLNRKNSADSEFLTAKGCCLSISESRVIPTIVSGLEEGHKDSLADVKKDKFKLGLQG